MQFIHELMQLQLKNPMHARIVRLNTQAACNQIKECVAAAKAARAEVALITTTTANTPTKGNGNGKQN